MIESLFETHIKVVNLDRSRKFYEGILGLTMGFQDPRRIHFYWIGGHNHSMLGLWENQGDIPKQHFAFCVSITKLKEAIELLQRHEIKTYNFFEELTDCPSVFGWMPAASIYFFDPDGHKLEFISPLEETAKPELGIISWDEWLSFS